MRKKLFVLVAVAAVAGPLAARADVGPAPTTPTSAQERDALPPNTRYVAPDGQVYVTGNRGASGGF